MLNEKSTTPSTNQHNHNFSKNDDVCLTGKMLEDIFEYIDFRVRQLQLANDYELIYNEAALDMKKVLMEHAHRYYVKTPFAYPGRVI